MMQAKEIIISVLTLMQNEAYDLRDKHLDNYKAICERIGAELDKLPEHINVNINVTVDREQE